MDAPTLEPTNPERPSPCVFINCPYDPAYFETFEYTMFSIACCGLTPVCANAIVGPPNQLIHVLDCIYGCEFSVHDLSRCSGLGSRNLSRFNMPLELGIAIGKNWDSQKQSWANLANWATMCPDHHDMYQVASNLGGYSPLEYQTEFSHTVIDNLVRWLRQRKGAWSDTDPATVRKLFGKYSDRKKPFEDGWGVGKVPTDKLIELALEIVAENAGKPYVKNRTSSDSGRPGQP